VFLGPEQVHAQEHLRPVLRVRATGTRVDADQGHVVGVGIAEEEVNLATADLLLEGCELLLQVECHRLVGLGVEHRCQLACVGGALSQ
jgi:hypothetical protein